jgi:hypothetical protein
MHLDSQLATETLETRLAEELEERTEFCDWLSCCSSSCGGGGTTTCTTGPSSSGTVCTTTPSKGW